MSNPNEKVNKPNIPFWRSYKSGTAKDSVIVTPKLYDDILANLKVGQILYLNLYEESENRPIGKIIFGPQLDAVLRERNKPAAVTPKTPPGDMFGEG